MYAWVCARIGVRRMTGPRMTGPLPRRAGAESVDSWAWFVAVARQSTSAVELLRSALSRRVIVHSVRHHDFLPDVPLERLRMLGDVEAVALDEHLLIDGEPPHPTLGLSSALVVPGRLPASVRPAFDRHEHTIAELLDAAGSFWTAEALEVEQLAVGGASFPSERSPDTRMLRLTRRLSVIGTPVAIVLDEIPEPRLPRSTAQQREVPLTHP